MTRGLPHALCRLLALLACVMCSQPGSRVMAQPLDPFYSTLQTATDTDAVEPGRSLVSGPCAPAEHDVSDPFGSEPSREEREQDDDEDQQDDDCDDAQLLGLRSALCNAPALLAAFGASLPHDPACSNHRLLDPRPPRRR